MLLLYPTIQKIKLYITLIITSHTLCGKCTQHSAIVLVWPVRPNLWKLNHYVKSPNTHGIHTHSQTCTKYLSMKYPISSNNSKHAYAETKVPYSCESNSQFGLACFP